MATNLVLLSGGLYSATALAPLVQMGGRVELNFENLNRLPPFTDEGKREELRRRIVDHSSLVVAADRIGKRPHWMARPYGFAKYARLASSSRVGDQHVKPPLIRPGPKARFALCEGTSDMNSVP